MKIELHPYDDQWPVLFEQERALISEVLREFQPKIEHIGSTSVPGLAAKPLIDIMIGLEHESHLDAIVPKMQEAGFSYNNRYEDELPFRRLFSRLIPKSSEDQIPRLIDKMWTDDLRVKYHVHTNIHSVTTDSDWWERHLLFRDYLRTHPEAMHAYAALKLKLAEDEWQHTNDYADAKTEFIRSIEKKAWKEKNAEG